MNKGLTMRTGLYTWLIGAALCGVVAAPGCGKKEDGGSQESTPEERIPEHGGHGHELGESEHEEHAEEVTLTEEAVRLFGIRTEPVKKHVLSDTLVAPARVSLDQEALAHVGTPVRGRVSELKVRLGDTVEPGAVLLVIDSPDLGEAQSDFLQKRTAVATATPVVEIARSSYERAKSLYEQTQGIALTEVQKREAEYKDAQGNLLSAQAASTAAENRLHLFGMSQDEIKALAQTGEINPRYTVRAPLSGQVIKREVTLGELVGPEREALLILADMSWLWVLADVPEAKLSRVRLGCRARVRVAAMGSKDFEGCVSHISPLLDPRTRSATVRIEIQDAQASGLRPGMFAQAEIQTSSSDDGGEPVLAVPEEAVQLVEGGQAVFVSVEAEKGTFAKRVIGVGPNIGGMRPVYKGLQEGERVVVSGSFILKAELGKGSAEHEH
jgi:cobalt-zinc-cadmium efflux system membrane fusion protein